VYRRLLVPLDFTEKNGPALDAARALAAQDRAGAVLLHVIETVEHLQFEELRSFYDKLAAEARTRLDRQSRTFADAGLAVETAVAFGKRVAEIVRFASLNGIDLIVLSSRAVGDERDVPVGTISHQVAVFAPCSVLLVK
jgi:nucleotide-binding universal stress UspA family protein